MKKNKKNNKKIIDDLNNNIDKRDQDLDDLNKY